MVDPKLRRTLEWEKDTERCGEPSKQSKESLHLPSEHSADSKRIPHFIDSKNSHTQRLTKLQQLRAGKGWWVNAVAGNPGTPSSNFGAFPLPKWSFVWSQPRRREPLENEKMVTMQHKFKLDYTILCFPSYIREGMNIWHQVIDEAEGTFKRHPL